jgi:hypothetical protein
MSFISGTIAAINQGDAADAANANQANATKTQEQIQQAAAAQQQANFNTVQTQEAPYRQLGEKNIGSLQQMISGGYDMKQSPSAQYALSEGTKSINSNLQARGLEGNAVQQLGQMSSSTAAQDYQNRFSQLLAATNIGSNAVSMTGSGANSLNASTQSGANAMTAALGAGAANSSNIAMGNAAALNNIGGGMSGAAAGVGGKLLGNYASTGNWLGASGAASGETIDGYSAATSSYPEVAAL